MGSLLLADALVLPCSTGSSLAPPVPASTRAGVAQCFAPRPPLTSSLRRIPLCVRNPSGKSRLLATALGGGGALLSDDSMPSNTSVYIVGDFMTKKEDLRVVKPTTTVDEALEMLVNNRITGFPVIDDDWKLVYPCAGMSMALNLSITLGESALETIWGFKMIAFRCYCPVLSDNAAFTYSTDSKVVGVVSDYDLLALDSISGSSEELSSEIFFVFSISWTCGRGKDADLFPEADSTWRTFSEIQKLLGKTNGKVVGDLMTPAPLVVHEATNLEDAARILLETKYRRLPVVDSSGNLVRLVKPPTSPVLSLGSLLSSDSSDCLFMPKVGIITRGNVIRAALRIKHETEKRTLS
ncbi:hypothetical protein Taro_042060 [Colocasia esculenta]|uniref:CBS domain-containing protein n=1 Tax=Colocasia esculenta TaxID=4460 RepID=A0A843WCZ8_COLES|nr:hypothetical protein [Colocasia esculenta]